MMQASAILCNLYVWEHWLDGTERLSPPDLHWLYVVSQATPFAGCGLRSCETTLASFPDRSHLQFCILQKLEVGKAWERGFLSDKPIPIYRIQRFSFPNCEPGDLLPQDLADLWTAISPVYTISSLEGKLLHEGMDSFFLFFCAMRKQNHKHSCSGTWFMEKETAKKHLKANYWGMKKHCAGVESYYLQTIS